MSEILTLKNINQYFFQGKNKVEVLKNLNFSISKASKIAIIGSSGSGKSSLLNIASLLQSPRSGDVFILGKNAARLKDSEKSFLRKKNIGYIHQQNTLLMEFNAYENIYLTLLLNGFNSSYAKEKALDLLKIVNLENRALHKPSALSGGEQQRIAIARALIAETKIILADEPTGNLDFKTSKEIFSLFLKLKKLKKTIIFATHNRELANRADYKLFISDGNIKRVNAR